jgi:hypothetical protein
VHCLARDAGISQATGYRYLHEGIDVLAAQAPDLHEVLDLCRAEEMTHVVLDGTLIACDRLAGVRGNGNDLWFSQKHKNFGGNIQFLAAPDGTPLWVSEVEPGSTPDITAARIHVLPALYKAAAEGLPTLADKGYIGAGIGIHVPVRRPKRPLRDRPGPRDPRHECADHKRAGARRADRGRTEGTLANPQTRHTQSQQNRRHSPRHTRPQRALEMIFADMRLSAHRARRRPGVRNGGRPAHRTQHARGAGGGGRGAGGAVGIVARGSGPGGHSGPDH